ncbi:RNA polymerase sigma-54 factor RpoN [Caballeronia glathei]|nr:sigma-70 family RNA polymerase sigma factor [Caballeronia glathei]CDY77160.1 RNA polymerase sigma-54 factor RpoN [Caballeronia glathei]
MDSHRQEDACNGRTGKCDSMAATRTRSPLDQENPDAASGTPSKNSPDSRSVLLDMLPRLWAFALRISRDRHDAEELVQRAIARAAERAEPLRPDRAALKWLLSTLYHMWINGIRARDMESDEASFEAFADHATCTQEHDRMSRQIVSAVDRLPEAQRIVMLLVEVEGLTHGEAAEVLGVASETIESRLWRAHQAMRILVGRVPAAYRADRGEQNRPAPCVWQAM